jgi:hypothetical protein
MNPGEGEAIVQFGLSTFPDLRLVPIEKIAASSATSGLPWPDLSESDRLLIRRFTPPLSIAVNQDPIADTCAFFIAKMCRLR